MTAKAAASLAAVAVVVALVAAASLVAVLKAKAMAVSNLARKSVVLTAVKTTVLKHLVATASSHAKVRLAATLVKTVVSAKVAVAHFEVILAMAKAHPAVTLVPHVASKSAPPAALTTVPPHVAHAPRLKQAAHRLTSQAVQPVASRLVAVLTPKSVHLSHAHHVN